MRDLIVDANLLVLLIVGLTSESSIGRHKRTREYDGEAFNLLLGIVDRASTKVVVTPHIVTETSNLLRQCADPLRTELARRLAETLRQSREEARPSALVVDRQEYLRLGITDAAILDAQVNGACLLTDDHGLYLASLAAGHAAINFAHLREGVLRT